MESIIYTASPTPGRGDLLLHSSIRQQGTGQFMELDSNLLMSDLPLYFNVYYHQGDHILRLLYQEGQSVPEPQRKKVCNHEAIPNLFVKVSEQDNVLRYMEKAVHEFMLDPAVDLDVRCTAAVSLTTFLCAEVFDKPLALNIFRLSENARQLLRLARGEPDAMAALIKNTHLVYQPYLHSVNVGLYSMAMALELYGRNSSRNFEDLIPAFFLHDIGKSRIKDEVLLKKGPLDSQQWEEVKKHPLHGYRILDREEQLTKENQLVTLQHHERPDGKGYPQGLVGDRIDPYARICSNAEAFCALTTQRPYKIALPPLQALQVMKKELNDQFDPGIFRALVLLIQSIAK